MKKLLQFFIGLLLLKATYSQQSVLIKQVTIVDVEKGSLVENSNVLIRNSKIVSISSSESNTTADVVIDGNNRYLIPGLWDMHVHMWSDKLFFPLLVANGITGVRDMFGPIDSLHAWRNYIASGIIAGPQIIAAGPILDGPKPIWQGSVAVEDAAQGRHAVDSLKNILHTDFIKVYSLLPRDAYFAIADEAKKQHIPFAGHVPKYITVQEAARAGQKSMEHLYGFLEAASDSADYYMQIIQQKIADSNIKTQPQIKRFLHRTYRTDKLQQVLQEVKKYHAWVCPTLTVNYNIAYANDTIRMKDPRLQYLPAFVTNFWNPANDFRLRNNTPETYELLKQDFKMKLQLVKPIFDAGIPILAGTDFPNPFCFPGFGLHDELEWLVKAGLTPAQALQTATINPVRYLNLQKQYGTVSTGKYADLLLLNDNPLTNISNTQHIQIVILHGKVYDKAALNKILADVKKLAGN